MPRVALVLYVAYVLVVFVGRMAWQYHRTGDHGFRGFSGRGAAAAWGGALFAVGMALGALAPAADLAGVGPSWSAPAVVPIAGSWVALLGFAVTLAAQLQMSASWRIGVDPGERTALVSRGLFALVRNPVFSGVMLFGGGLALLTPGPISMLALACVVLGVEIQVRRVEEPYLRQAHGEGYLAYARAVGRFVPGVGRLS